MDGVPPDDGAAWTLWWDARQRELRATTSRATWTKETLEVDGEPMEFDVAALPGMWSAWRLEDNYLVVVSARGFDAWRGFGSRSSTQQHG